MANNGAAADYYKGPEQYNNQGDRAQYALQQHQYSQQPPNYGQNYDGAAAEGGQKPTFDQAFKIERPRWNDLWAGILFLIVFAGFVAVSGLSIHGYGELVRILP